MSDDRDARIMDAIRKSNERQAARWAEMDAIRAAELEMMREVLHARVEHWPAEVSQAR